MNQQSMGNCQDKKILDVLESPAGHQFIPYTTADHKLTQPILNDIKALPNLANAIAQVNAEKRMIPDALEIEMKNKKLSIEDVLGIIKKIKIYRCEICDCRLGSYPALLNHNAKSKRHKEKQEILEKRKAELEAAQKKT